MNKRLRMFQVATFAAGAILAGPSLKADVLGTVTAKVLSTYDSSGNLQQTLLENLSTVNPTSSGGLTQGGAFQWTTSGVNNGGWNWDSSVADVPGYPTRFFTYCVQIDQTINPGSTYTYQILDLNDNTVPDGTYGMSKAQLTLVRNLWANVNPTNKPPIDANHAAAFEVALWEIIYDSTYDSTHTPDVTTGSFKLTGGSTIPSVRGGSSVNTTSAVIALANDYLQHDLGTPVLAPGAQLPVLYGLTNPTRQDQVFALGFAAADNPGVPLPPAACLVGALLGSWGAARRARSAKV